MNYPVRLSLAWRWFLGLAALLVLLLVVVNIAIDLTLPAYLVDRIRGDLQREALLARQAFTPLVPASDPAPVNQLAHALAQQTGLRITIIAADGTVIGESEKPTGELAQMENHLNRPEVQSALSAGVGMSIRRSDTLGVDLMYVAVVAPDGKGFVRVALPLTAIAHISNRVRGTVALASLVVVLLALPVVFRLSRRLTGPIEEMRAMALRVTSGDFSRRAPERGGPELQELGVALNQMSHQLETRLAELAAEKSELQATLANMIEGVLVVDASSRLRLVNAALKRQFNLGDAALGKTVLEALRSAPLQDLITQVLAQGQVSGRELAFFGAEESVFDVTAACLRGPDNVPAGAVVVFHDITRIKRLENIRKEFVANVSHELRTPLAVIKGYIETLLDERPPDAATTRQFLETVQRHSGRLEALVNDLLSISELESQQAQLNLVPVAVAAAAHAAVDELSQRARDKRSTVTIDVPPDLPAVRADAGRLHQVLVNLLDNAIKYTPPDSQIAVAAKPSADAIELTVTDNGPGIAPEHLARIFERFYRVDKARSRELGGTGLGLAIVKHIVQAHGGRVWAESESERGTTFHFTLPRA